MNFAVYSGRLVKDPEIRYTNSKKAVATFTVAVDGGKSADGEKKTAFIDCVAWEKRAEFIDQNFLKGTPIIVAGRTETRTYEAKDGTKRKVTELVVTSVEFQRGKTQVANARDLEPSSSEFEEVTGDDGELPF